MMLHPDRRMLADNSSRKSAWSAGERIIGLVPTPTTRSCLLESPQWTGHWPDTALAFHGTAFRETKLPKLCSHVDAVKTG